jgi:6-phosphogluconolactonase
MTGTQRCRWIAVRDRAALDVAASAAILAAANRAIGARGQFHLVLCGGETPRGAYRKLSMASADWPSWHIYFGDERCLPADDPARNSVMAAAAWLDHVAIPPAQRHAIRAELGPERAAALYADVLEPVGKFDMVLLGLGEDGHTASLFPDREWGRANHCPYVLAVIDAPKPPAHRVSLSAARLGRARQVIFVVAGEGKRGAVAAWRSGRDMPARAIAPVSMVKILVEAALLAC